MKTVSTIVTTTAAPEERTFPVDERMNPQEFDIQDSKANVRIGVWYMCVIC